MNLKIRPEMADHPMAKAAREVNAYCDSKGLEATCEHYDLNVDDVRYIAEQRALRAIWAFKGVNLQLKEATILMLTPQELSMYIQLTAAYMDGLVIGYRAKEFANET